MRSSLWLFLVFCGWATQLAAQPLSTKSKKAIELYTQADNFRVRGQLIEAVALLQQAIEKDKKFEEAYFRLGLVYRSAGELAKSNQSLENGFALTSDPIKKKNYQYLLCEGYLRVGNYRQSLEHGSAFLAAEKFDKKKLAQVDIWRRQCQFSIDNLRTTYNYKVRPLSDTVNALPMQYFPTITPDESELIFTVRYGKAHDDNEDIFISRREANGQWGKPISISAQINTNFREGASTISADGRLLIFTICGYQGCDLYQSKKVGDQWTKPTNLGTGVNSLGWEAQPALSADGNTLFFVSDRRGGLGGYDIWVSQRDEEGNWQKAFNAGKGINTAFDEIAPFLHSNGLNLYYASNGLPGFGGYDIYVAERQHQQWREPKNLGHPLNDFSDQYSFVVNAKGDLAYYSKEEGKNQSKVYSALIPEEWRVSRRSNIVRGTVVDATTKKPLKAKIELHDLKLDTLLSVFSSDSIVGSYLFVLPAQSEYAVYANSQGYLFTSLHFNSDSTRAEQLIDLQLQPLQRNAEIVLKNIFFDFNKFEVSEKSKVELKEVADFLRANPQLRVEIGGHTDNVGSPDYNLKLSEKRAEAVRAELVARGIEPIRMKAVGYGSKEPAVENSSEANRALNRRILFKILSKN
ncbi:MAG: OmpA family protein [Cytophagales bacterium]|nr:OmpA family protein [Cytophagales bacterium]